MIRYAIENLPFNSIIVDISYYEKAENLVKTKELIEYYHKRGITTEAEPGRIKGGEDSISDILDLSSLLTTAEEAMDFIEIGVNFLALEIRY